MTDTDLLLDDIFDKIHDSEAIQKLPEMPRFEHITEAVNQCAKRDKIMRKSISKYYNDLLSSSTSAQTRDQYHCVGDSDDEDFPPIPALLLQPQYSRTSVDDEVIKSAILTHIKHRKRERRSNHFDGDMTNQYRSAPMIYFGGGTSYSFYLYLSPRGKYSIIWRSNWSGRVGYYPISLEDFCGSVEIVQQKRKRKRVCEDRL